MDLVRTRVKKQSDKWKAKVDLFNTDRTKLFDIFSENSDARKNREMETGVSMGPDEWAFLNDQRSERKMYCDDFLDKVWVAQVAQRQKKDERIERLQKAKQSWEEKSKSVSWSEIENNKDSDIAEIVQDEAVESTSTGKNVRHRDFDYDYDPITDSQALEASDSVQGNKKRRIMTAKLLTHDDNNDNSDNKDDMPYQYRHIRNSAKIVKPIFYRTVDKIKSVNHCSNSQAIGSVILTANGLFGRSWKLHKESEVVIDLDTAPNNKAVIESGKALTALCLSEIVEEMMAAAGGVITYHDDGSKTQGVGGYSV